MSATQELDAAVAAQGPVVDEMRAFDSFLTNGGRSTAGTLKPHNLVEMLAG